MKITKKTEPTYREASVWIFVFFHLSSIFVAEEISSFIVDLGYRTIFIPHGCSLYEKILNGNKSSFSDDDEEHYNNIEEVDEDDVFTP